LASCSRQSGFDVAEALSRDFLTWLAGGCRTYAETMAAWRTCCPRFSIWEDALAENLIQIVPKPGQPVAHARVQLTPRGRAVLDRQPRADDAQRP
jgi:hypothetical protein